MYTLTQLQVTSGEKKKDKKANFPGSAYLPVGTLVEIRSHGSARRELK